MIIIGADHAGFDLKQKIKDYLDKNNMKYIDVTDYDKNNDDDYTLVAFNISKEVLKDTDNLGIAICGTGIGISVACNKIKGIIATPCFNKYIAKMAKNDNNSNILCLGGRLEYTDDIIDIVDVYLKENFLGGRHLRRVQDIKKLEDKFGDNIWE